MSRHHVSEPLALSWCLPVLGIAFPSPTPTFVSCSTIAIRNTKSTHSNKSIRTLLNCTKLHRLEAQSLLYLHLKFDNQITRNAKVDKIDPEWFWQKLGSGMGTQCQARASIMKALTAAAARIPALFKVRLNCIVRIWDAPSWQHLESVQIAM